MAEDIAKMGARLDADMARFARNLELTIIQSHKPPPTARKGEGPDPVAFWSDMAARMIARGWRPEDAIGDYINAALDLGLAHYGDDGALLLAAQLRAIAERIDKAVTIARA